MSNIVIKDFNKFKDGITNFNNSINNIEKIFTNIDKNIYDISKNDIWQGEFQEATYNKYNELSSNYDIILQSLKELSSFMDKTLNAYTDVENSTMSDIDNNSINLDVNS